MRRARSLMSRLAGMVVTLALLGLTGPGVQAPISQAAPLAQAGPKLVLAFYYMWYSPEVFSSGQMSDRPVSTYSSADPATIDRQVQDARSAGIDAFITSWEGAGTGSDNTFRLLLDRAAAHGFQATIYFETQAVMQHGDVASQLQAALSKYAGHPAFLHWNGKPVVFVWSPQSLGGVDAWRAVRQRVDPNNTQIWSVDTTDKSYLDVFDTIHFFSAGKWNAATSVAQVDTRWRGITDDYNRAHGTNKLWVAGVIPGWDESRIPGRASPKVFPRRDGAMYEEDWKAAIASNPDWITITSYNEWFEGTQIEPSAGYGSRYLDLTRQYASLWKTGPSPCDGGSYFQPTDKSICKKMEGYWQQYGGLAQFGYPISGWQNEVSPTDGKTYTVQYFERARFELHPEKAGTPYEVMLSQLGAVGFKQKYPGGALGQKPNRDAAQFFPETGHWVGGAFWQQWQIHGGLFVNGFPISDEFQEQAADGKTYTVQYFERARFEFHPENQAPYNVLLGTLGRQLWDTRGR